MNLTEQQALELGRRAVAVVPIERWPLWSVVYHEESESHGILKQYHWRGGSFLYITDEHGSDWHTDGSGEGHMQEWLPALRTPAGLGSLLELVREAWGDPGLVPLLLDELPSGDGRGWFVSGDCVGVEADTEAEALIAALESAQ